MNAHCPWREELGLEGAGGRSASGLESLRGKGGMRENAHLNPLVPSNISVWTNPPEKVFNSWVRK